MHRSIVFLTIVLLSMMLMILNLLISRILPIISHLLLIHFIRCFLIVVYSVIAYSVMVHLPIVHLFSVMFILMAFVPIRRLAANIRYVSFIRRCLNFTHIPATLIVAGIHRSRKGNNTMADTKIVLLQDGAELIFVEMPATHAYQLEALIIRLHKELGKLTADNVPSLPHAVAELSRVEFLQDQYSITRGLDYINQLEASFAAIREQSYPLIALLTEIRALQAQLEQWYEEET